MRTTSAPAVDGFAEEASAVLVAAAGTVYGSVRFSGSRAVPAG
ncbi:hypothetical protein [Litorihabitans aurantiacus]|nr:hypothetical protein [Litorihabitans aurantiacus]